MPFGTACHRLRKSIMFEMLKGRHFDDKCFKCGKPIDTAESMSIEHKIDWQGKSAELFWDIENIAFSHRKCNRPSRMAAIKAGITKRKVGPPGTAWCNGHKKFLPVSRFYKKEKRWSGYTDRCRDCILDYNHKMYKSHPRPIIIPKCKICGSFEVVARRFFCIKHWREHQREVMQQRRKVLASRNSAR